MDNLTDQVRMIGAWEWTIPANQCFSGTIKHWEDQSKKDTVLLLNQFFYRRDTTSADWQNFKKEYPAWAYESTIRRDNRFFVFGRFTGTYDQNSVKELSNYANAFELYANTPNPVSNETNIKFDIKQSSFVTLKVYNQLGEEVASLVNEFMEPGQFEANFDASALTPGTYFYTLSTGNFNKTLPMLIVR
ncbi:MAG: hypothetical protein A2X64_01880 [Ignavibacteria bacterium GWF2_33_9]|nr:MAG: hypothetical protein A2X64_01880 [Ignavibacteria bacterium GWF2_33_9]